MEAHWSAQKRRVFLSLSNFARYQPPEPDGTPKPVERSHRGDRRAEVLPLRSIGPEVPSSIRKSHYQIGGVKPNTGPPVGPRPSPGTSTPCRPRPGRLGKPAASGTFARRRAGGDDGQVLRRQTETGPGRGRTVPAAGFTRSASIGLPSPGPSGHFAAFRPWRMVPLMLAQCQDRAAGPPRIRGRPPSTPRFSRTHFGAEHAEHGERGSPWRGLPLMPARCHDRGAGPPEHAVGAWAPHRSHAHCSCGACGACGACGTCGA